MRLVSCLSLLIVVVVLLLPALAAGQTEPWHQSDFPPEEFEAPRTKIFDRIGNDAVALVQGVAMTNASSIRARPTSSTTSAGSRPRARTFCSTDATGE